MKLFAANMLVLSTLTSPFSDCGNSWSRTAQPMVPPSPPSKPCCFTDPPPGCMALCSTTGEVSFTDSCNGVAAGPWTDAFEQKIDAAEAFLEMQGQVCDPAVMVTPCNLNILPVEWPNQDHNVCMPTPPACVTSW